VELEEQKAAFERQGIAVAALSYDSVDVLKDFAARKNITYPLLSDPQSEVIRGWGLLNETVPKGTPFFGVPWPGGFFIDPQGVVRARYFEKDYRERYTAGNVLLHIGAPDGAGWREVRTKHLTLRYGASDEEARGGSRVTLGLTVMLPRKMHVYAPGVEGGYIPIRWTVDAPGFAKLAEEHFPASRTLRLEAIKETVPVYEGRFTLTRDATFAQERELLSAGGEARQISIKGSFRYQACDDRECYPPVEVPLEWSFRVAPHDRTRVPEALRRK
jgi:hypothetical protein